MSAAEETPETSGRMTIGLTFGNTNSSIAFTGPDGKAEVIANEEGDRQIPTILSYVGGEEYQGTQAKAQLVRNPRNTVAFFRDFLGKEFKDVDPRACQQSAHPEPRDGGKTACFQVQEGESDEKSCLSVEEIAIRHIRRLRQSAADYLGREVNSAVLTIPSDSSDAQKAAVCAVAAKAGIEIIQTIPEPISALLAHDAKQQLSGESDPASQDKIVLVADLGGIRSDVAVVANRNGMYTTLATAHDYELGGKALDEVLIEYAAKEFLKKNKTAADPRSNERSLAKLTLEAEAVKKSLSLGQSASFSIESLVDGIDFSLTVNRTRYELLANKVFMSFTRLIEAAVKKANLDILDVDHILLSGGTAHTPKIASNLRSHFPESTTVTAPSTTATAVNPSELSARGAAIQASLVSEFEQSDIESSIEPVVTVAPHTSAPVGLATENGFTVIVPENTPVPARRTAQISVAAGGDVLLRLTEGSREIKVTTEEKPASNGAKDEDDSDEDDSDDEPEEIREKVFKAGKTLAEAGVRGVKKDGKVEVQVNIAADLTITFVAREVGGKGGVRGTVAA